jgi:hypothetical protein
MAAEASTVEGAMAVEDVGNGVPRRERRNGKIKFSRGYKYDDSKIDSVHTDR